MRKDKIERVLFYHGHIRGLRTTLIGHLYELSQVYPVLLLSDGLDRETETIIRDKKLFPKLERIIFVDRPEYSKKRILRKSRDLCRSLKKIINTYRPDVVITPNDLFPSFLYLMRFARRINALNLCIQASLDLGSFQVRLEGDLTNAYLKFPIFLPRFLRLFLVRCRNYCGHLLYYWILPMLVGQMPFLGKSSFILRKGGSGLRDSDYQIVFSQREYNLYRESGVPTERLYILKHPLARQPTRDFFRKALLGGKEDNADRKTAVLLLPSDDIGFRRKDLSFIPEKERREERIRIIKIVIEAFQDWKIFVKPHPNYKNYEEIKGVFESLSDSVKVVDPQDSSDKYIKESEVVIGLPRSASTALFTASLLFPEKAILSLDFQGELLGDSYKDFAGVEYIDNEKKLIEMLSLISNGKYQKIVEKKLQKEEDFANTIEMLNSLFNQKHHIVKKQI